MDQTVTCDIIHINGDRDAVVDCLLNRLRWDRAGAAQHSVVLVTSETQANLDPWASVGLRDLARPPRIDVRLDFENLFFALYRRGYSTRPEHIIAMLKATLGGDGDIVNITAYADWSVLVKACGYDIQREMTRQGVDTRYVISVRGKNSADMRIVNDIRTLIERAPRDPDSAEVIVLGSHDRDFQSLFETARARGRRLILLGLRDDISRLLLQTARDVRYLDLAFVAPDKPISHRDGQPASAATTQPRPASIPWSQDPRPARAAKAVIS